MPVSFNQNIFYLWRMDDEKYWSVGTPEQYYDYLQKKFGSVKKSNLDSMTRGWLIGNFEPSILKTDFY